MNPNRMPKQVSLTFVTGKNYPPKKMDVNKHSKPPEPQPTGCLLKPWLHGK